VFVVAGSRTNTVPLAAWEAFRGPPTTSALRSESSRPLVEHPHGVSYPHDRLIAHVCHYLALVPEEVFSTMDALLALAE